LSRPVQADVELGIGDLVLTEVELCTVGYLYSTLSKLPRYNCVDYL